MTRPVPILLVTLQLDVGGNERDLTKLARFLNPARFQVHVASFRPGGQRVAELEAAGIPMLDLPVRSFLDRSALDGAKVLRAYAREHGIKLIHAFDPPTSIFAVSLAKLSGLRAVSSHCFSRFLIPQPYRRTLRMVDFLADRIVVNADAVKQHLMKDYGIAERRIFVSNNGVETKVFFPRNELRPAVLDGASFLHDASFLQDASLVIGSMCVMREEKRLDTLIEAFARVLPRNPRLRLLLVGDGEMRDAWMKRRDELGLASACHFEQTTTDVPRWMALMDVFVMPSRSEGFPNALLEAMASGCCVIASAVGGIPELVEDGRSGILFPAGDVDSLTGKLLSLMENPQLRRAIAEVGAIRARDKFSMEAAAARMETLYDSLL